MNTHIDSATLDQVGNFLGTVSGLAKNYQIYGIDHPRTRKATEDYHRCAEGLSRCPTVQDELIVAYHDGRFYLEHVPLVVDRHDSYLFVAHLETNGMAGFRMSLSLQAAELQEVLKLLAAQPSSQTNSEAGAVWGFRWLAPEEMNRLESAAPRDHLNLHLILQLPELRIEEDAYLRTMETLDIFSQQCTDVDPGDIDSVHRASDELFDRFVENSDRLMPLTTIPYANNFTYQHSLNVSLLTLRAASRLALSPAHLRRIGRVALLHDIGKSAIPPEILHKPSRLTRSEAAIVMEHPVIGARRLAQLPNVDPLAPVVAFGHHIKDGGQGYPKVAPGYRIGPVTALVEVADIFEALTAQRPYKKAVTATEAFRALYSMPNMSSFRPQVDLLARAIGFHPVGSRVRGVDDEIGVVVGHGDDDPRRPVVRPLKTESGGRFRLGEARVRNGALRDTPAAEEESVTALDPDEDIARFA